ncbi:hypothetical protein Hanom_Chr16g01504881 [Helianthus anomalus]
MPSVSVKFYSIISGLLHLLVRFLIKHHSSSNSHRSNRFPDGSPSAALQRQLQQLFHLHDSGIYQTFIDTILVFMYKEVVGANEPFDCAVCLFMRFISKMPSPVTVAGHQEKGI